MAVYRVSAQWLGFTGAPGYSNFHFGEFTGGADVDQMRGRVRDFFEAFEVSLPAGVSITIPETVEVFDEATGELTGWENGEEPMVVNANTQGDRYAGPVGAVVNWMTNTVNNGRRVRGRTFVVPLANTVYDDDGSLTTTFLGNARAAATALAQNDFNSDFSVWSRPSNGSPGVLAPVTGSNVPDLAAVLRSRRD